MSWPGWICVHCRIDKDRIPSRQCYICQIMHPYRAGTYSEFYHCAPYNKHVSSIIFLHDRSQCVNYRKFTMKSVHNFSCNIPNVILISPNRCMPSRSLLQRKIMLKKNEAYCYRTRERERERGRGRKGERKITIIELIVNKMELVRLDTINHV